MANEKRLKLCGDCIHVDICKEVNSGWFSRENPAYCKGFKDRANYVEVVRCKDCKWVEKGKDYEPYCNHWKSGLYANVKDDDFCSYGERKDNG